MTAGRERQAWQPLAARLRPDTLDAYVGQQHLLARGRPLREALESGQLHSMILWGPPGVGKTTLARLMCQACEAHFIAVSAVLSGVKEIRAAIEEAQFHRQHGRRTVLFVDEVHRFNKAVKSFLNQGFRRVIVQIFGLHHCSEVGSHV